MDKWLLWRWHRARPKVWDSHSETPASQLVVRCRIVCLNFSALICLTHDGKHRDIGKKKVIAFPSLPPTPSPREYSMWGPYINTARTRHPDREGMRRDAVSPLFNVQHFMPGVTHQPSHQSAVKCQQSQIPQTMPVFSSTGADEYACGHEWVLSLFLISILSVYSMSSRLESETGP